MISRRHPDVAENARRCSNNLNEHYRFEQIVYVIKRKERVVIKLGQQNQHKAPFGGKFN